MRDIKLGDKVIGARATTLALLFYKQEFKRPMVADYTKFSLALNEDENELDDMALLQFLWAMHRADCIGTDEKVPHFEAWLGTLEGIDFGDANLWKDVLTELGEGIFPKATKKVTKKK